MNRNSGRIDPVIPLFLFVFFALMVPSALLAQKNKIAESKIEKEGKSYSITVSFPQMIVPKDALMGERGTMADFNQPIEDITSKRIGEFMAGIDPTDSAGPKDNNTLNILYETYTDNNNIYSIKFEAFSEMKHAAHPNSVFDVFNFSFDSWNPFGLKDIFLPNSNYLKKISEYCIRDLTKQAKEKHMDAPAEITKGASADEKNFNTFNISGDRLLITFQYYQTGPRPFGAPVVSMPLSELKDMIDPMGPLGYMVKP